MMKVLDLLSWLFKQKPEDDVFVDEGGLTLHCLQSKGYIEVGGKPETEGKKLINLAKLGTCGICISCEDKLNCPMKQMLPNHWAAQAAFGTEDYEQIDPGTWEEYAVENPEIDEQQCVTWCPMYSVKI